MEISIIIYFLGHHMQSAVDAESTDIPDFITKHVGLPGDIQRYNLLRINIGNQRQFFKVFLQHFTKLHVWCFQRRLGTVFRISWVWSWNLSKWTFKRTGIHQRHGLINRVFYKKRLVHKDLEGCTLCLHVFFSVTQFLRQQNGFKLQ